MQPGSLACLGCGREHNCGIHGCAILREAIAFVGDRLYTDVACGTQNGACGILVMTGETTPEMLAESSFFPDAVFPSLGAMAPLL